MSSRPSVPTVDLTLKPSLPSILFVIGVTILAGAAVYFSGMALPVKVMATAVILGAGGYWTLDKGLRLMPFSITRAVLLPDDECVIFDRRGRTRSTNLTGGVVLGSLFAVLFIREGRLSSRALCLFPDSVTRDLHRRLRMRLRVSAFTGDSHFARLVRQFWGRFSKQAD